jgi:hypothetical protein
MDMTGEQLGIALIKASKLGDKYAGSALDHRLKKLFDQVVAAAERQDKAYYEERRWMEGNI